MNYEDVLCARAERLEMRAMAAEKDAIALLFLLAEIRAAAGDEEGRLMQDELVALIKKQADQDVGVVT